MQDLDSFPLYSPAHHSLKLFRPGHSITISGWMLLTFFKSLGFVFVVFDNGAYDAIVKDNIVLYDAIKLVGSLLYIHGNKKRSKFFRRCDRYLTAVKSEGWA